MVAEMTTLPTSDQKQMEDEILSVSAEPEPVLSIDLDQIKKDFVSLQAEGETKAIATTSVRTSATTQVKLYQCPFCPKNFDNHRALGGHKSKTHPGMSETYRNKMIKRKLREGNRESHNQMKAFLVTNV